MKICSKCRKELDYSCFFKDKTKKDGFESSCKYCKKLYFEKNKEEINKRRKESRIKNKDKISKRSKQFYKVNKDRIIERQKKYYKINKEDILKKQKDGHKIYYEKNKEYILKKERDRYNNRTEEEKENYRKRKREYKRKRTNNDINFKLSQNMRSRLCNVLSGRLKHGNTFDLVGCDIDKLKDHLESQFTEGMSWENYGEWHIDHIIPCCSFNLEFDTEQEKCFHYTNLQPLWKYDNLSKGGKYNE